MSLEMITEQAGITRGTLYHAFASSLQNNNSDLTQACSPAALLSDVLAKPGHERKTYELAGDKAYRLEDLAAEVARQTGKPYSYQNLTAAQHAGVLEQIGLPKMLAEVVAGVEAQGVSTGVLHDDGRALTQLIGRPTTTLSEAVANVLAAPARG